MNAYRCGTDLGDMIASFAVVRHLGKGHIRMYGTPGTKGLSDERYNAIKPLIEIQPWAESVARFDENEGLPISHDFSGFRANWNSHPTLIGKQAIHVGLGPAAIDPSPWLTIPDAPRHGKIVICRSQRCLGLFHWFRLFQTKPKDCIFLGVEEDYKNFCHDNSPWPPHKKNMPKIEFRPTKDLLEAAKIIMGARLFICNQTACLWLALSTGFTPLFVEQVNEDSYLPAEGRRYFKDPQDNLSLTEFEKL